MSPIRVGIIGLAATVDYAITGAWGVIAHLRSMQALPDEYEVVAVANSSVESARRSIEFHKLPATTKAYGKPEDISADPNVDLVIVSVKVSDHLRLTKPVLENKKSVFVEWPLGASVAQAEELTKLATSHGVKTVVGLQARSSPLVQKVKEILASGKIGPVTSSTVTMCNSMLRADQGLKGAEFLLDSKSGQTVFTVLFGHFIDSFTYLLGDFNQVHAILKSEYSSVPIVDPSNGQVINPSHPKTAPDNFFVQGTLDNEAVASIAFRQAKSAADKVGTRWYITGTKGEIVITTEEGVWQGGVDPQLSIRVVIGEGTEAEEVDFTSNDTSRAAKVLPPGTNTARIYENFANGNGEEVATFESALKTHRLLKRVAQSAGWELP